MRLFVAFDPPPALRDTLASFCDAAASDVPPPADDDADDDAPGGFVARWSPPEQYHVTLRFIGEVDAADRYADALAAADAPAFTARPYGLDLLPARRRPRVLMVGLDLTDGLKAAYRSIRDALDDAGLDAEDRDFRPHLTLARLRDADPVAVHHFLRRQEEALDASELEPFEVDAFHLYSSTRTPDGAVHERLRTFPLDG